MTQLISTPRPAVRPTPAARQAGSNGAVPAPEVRETRTDDLEALAGSSVSARWFAQLAGMDSRTVERMCEEGKLLSVRPAGVREQLIPLWQLGEDGRPSPALPLVFREAQRVGLDSVALHKLMCRRAGLTGGEQLGDVLRAGRHEHVLSVIRAA